MPPRSDSSRRRYADYRRRVKERGAAEAEHTDAASRRRRTRTFVQLFARFWGILRGHRGMMLLSLLTLSFATGLGLLSPLLTKFTFDYALTDTPGPAGMPLLVRRIFGIGDPAAMTAAEITDVRLQLLWIAGIALIVLALTAILFGMWGRWQVTRITKRLQASLRRRVFEH